MSNYAVTIDELKEIGDSTDSLYEAILLAYTRGFERGLNERSNDYE